MEKFQRGNLLYFNPFVFPDGGAPKPKYFLVLADIGEDVILASLPTSKDHVPADVILESGCIELSERMVNVFVLLAGEPVTTDGFSFRVNTFIYGANVKTYTTDAFVAQENANETVISIIGKMRDDVFSRIIECLKNSDAVRKRYKKFL